MNTPVSFELAKLLKEKGFDVNCDGYTIHGKMTGVGNSAKQYSAPTIAEVVMWLYDKYGIWISVTKHTKNGLRCFSPYIDNKSVKEDAFFNDYDRPTEAYEAAIEHTLKHLI